MEISYRKKFPYMAAGLEKISVKMQLFYWKSLLIHSSQTVSKSEIKYRRVYNRFEKQYKGRAMDMPVRHGTVYE